MSSTSAKPARSRAKTTDTKPTPADPTKRPVVGDPVVFGGSRLHRAGEPVLVKGEHVRPHEEHVYHPRAAIVTDVNEDGTVELAVFERNSMRHEHSVDNGDGIGAWSWPR